MHMHVRVDKNVTKEYAHISLVISFHLSKVTVPKLQNLLWMKLGMTHLR